MAEAKRKPNAKKRQAGKTDNSEVLDSSAAEVKRLASTSNPFFSLCFLVTLKLLLYKRWSDSALGCMLCFTWYTVKLDLSFRVKNLKEPGTILLKSFNSINCYENFLRGTPLISKLRCKVRRVVFEHDLTRQAKEVKLEK